MKQIIFTLTFGLLLSGAAIAQVNNSSTTPVKGVETEEVESSKEVAKADKKECSKKEQAGCCKKDKTKAMATAEGKSGCHGSAKAEKSKACCKKGSAKAEKGCHGSKAMATNEDDKTTSPEEKSQKQ